MKLISMLELQNRTDGELTALFSEISKGLVGTKRDTAERRNGLASLENISRARRVQLSMSGP